MTKIGIVGAGRLGTLIREAIEAGKAPECELVGVSSRSLGVTPMDLVAKGAQILIEASKPEALKGFLLEVLAAGVSVIPLSTGALADPEPAVGTADCHAASLLAAVLDGLQRHESVAGGAIHPVDSNYAALLVQLIKAIFKQDHSLLWFQSYTKHKISIFSVWIYRQLSKNRN